MKHLTLYLSLLTLIVITFISCDKDESAPKPVADFTMSKSSALVGETVNFINNSENANSYRWEFGDGNTSTAVNSSHSYSSNGSYMVTLTSSGEGGESSTSKTIDVMASLSGAWNKTFELGGQDWDGELELTQNNDNSISGSFVFVDGSGYTTLTSASKINNQNVTIEWILGDEFTMKFTGQVNNSFTSMNGSYTTDGVTMGNWSANKITKSRIKTKHISNRTILFFEVKQLLEEDFESN